MDGGEGINMVRQPDLVLAGCLIDGTGAAPRERMAVLLRHGHIAAVLEQSELTPTHRQDAAVLDLEDATLLPGLIDSHVHLTFSASSTHDAVRRAVSEESDAFLALRALRNAQAHLAAGVTTLRDVGGRGYVTLAVRDAVQSGLVLGPRMVVAGPAITTPEGHLNYLGAVAANADEVTRRATEILDAGADFLKICATGGVMTSESEPLGSQYTEAELRRAVEVAESRGTLVAAHVLASEALQRCVSAGVRSIEHCFWQDAPGEYRFRPEVAEVMKQRRIFAGLTFAGISQMRYLQHTGQLERPVALGAWQERFIRRFAAERQMIDAGVPYVLHSDAGVRETPFGAFWAVVGAACFELKLTPLEAITAVTATPAELLGMAHDIGTLTPGKRADMFAVTGNPAEHIEALAHPEVVLLHGRVVARGGEVFGSPVEPVF